MAAPQPTAVSPVEYRFGRYRLLPAAHELWKEGELWPVAPLVFTCLIYLLENRYRTVSVDELVSAVWGRLDVADAQVRQLIVRVRQLVDDNATEQRAIRTIPGFGYRWVMEVSLEAASEAPASPPDAVAAENIAADEAARASLGNAPAADDAPIAIAPASEAVAPSVAPPRLRLRTVLAGITVVVLLAVGAWWLRSDPAPPVPNTPAVVEGNAVVILPLEVNAPDEFAWTRLGGMDLVAGRMRNAGLPVPPSDDVLLALRTAGGVDAGDEAELRRILGAGTLVSGSAIRSVLSWKVILQADTPDGLSYRGEAQRDNVVDATTAATDMLLAALGRTGVADVTQNIDLRERLQQARAATLASHLDLARSILLGSSYPEDPEIRYALAHIDLRGGQFKQAAVKVDGLLDDPVVADRPLLRARVLLMRGALNMLTEVCDGRPFDAAVLLLRNQPRTPEYGLALARRGHARAVCEQRYDLAAEDLSTARTLLAAAGDRLGVMHVDNYFGSMELARHHPTQAISHFREAAATSESFGAVDWLRANLSALLDAHVALLQWPEVEATSKKLFALRDRVAAPQFVLLLHADRAHVLVESGRHDEASRVLATGMAAYPNGRDDSPAWRYIDAVRGELAWRDARFGDAADSSAQALGHWSDSYRDIRRDATILLHQRALIAAGRAGPNDGPDVAKLVADAAARDALAPTLQVVAAEWAAYRGLDTDADLLFRSATSQAGSHAVPQEVTLVAQARARWLLSKGKPEDAAAEAGRVALWASRDFDSAMLQVEVFHALRQWTAWAQALEQARSLAGERTIPDALLTAPAEPR